MFIVIITDFSLLQKEHEDVCIYSLSENKLGLQFVLLFLFLMQSILNSCQRREKKNKIKK